MKKVLLLALILRLIPLSVYSQSLRLSVNLPIGCSFNTESSLDLFVEQEFMGIRYNTKMVVNTLLYMEVQSLDADSNYLISASYRKMNIHVTGLLVNMEVNSVSNIPGDSLSLVLGLLQGKEFKILFSNTGRILNIFGLDDIISKTINSSSLPEDQKPEFTRNLVQSIGEEVLLDQYSVYRNFYPASPVIPLARWEYKFDVLKSGIPMLINTQIKLKSVSGNLAFMISEGTISPQKALEADDEFTGSVNNISGNEVSEITMDIKTGLILEDIVSQNISGVLKTPTTEENSATNIPFKIISRRTAHIIALE